jgi:hypothetical protein
METRKNEPLYIGIDPDVTKSGFAVWHKPLQKFSSIEALTLPEMLDKLHLLRDNIALVVVEAGWLNASNWHLAVLPKSVKIRNPAKRAAELGVDQGRNHQRGMDIVEILEWMRIPYRLQKPSTKNSWKNDEKIFQKMTGVKGGNPEKRDAAMLVFGL